MARVNVWADEPKAGAVSELIEKTMLRGSEAESDIETVSVLVGAKREHCKLVVLEVQVAALASIITGMSMTSL